jgi:hypothetical protein
MFGKGKRGPTSRPTTRKRRRGRAQNKIGPQGFDSIGNREIESFVALKTKMFSMV